MQFNKIIQRNTTIHCNDNMEITTPVVPVNSNKCYSKDNLIQKKLLFDPLISSVDKENLPLHMQIQSDLGKYSKLIMKFVIIICCYY